MAAPLLEVGAGGGVAGTRMRRYAGHMHTVMGIHCDGSDGGDNDDHNTFS